MESLYYSLLGWLEMLIRTVAINGAAAAICHKKGYFCFVLFCLSSVAGTVATD
jgi:hypothetical protein